MERFQDQVALVTGGSRGIGAAVCSRLASEGARVWVGYKERGDSAQEVVEGIRSNGGHASPLQLDVRDSASVQGAIDTVVAADKRIDVLIHSAGITLDGLLLRMEDEQWEQVVNTNAGGAFRLCRAVGKRMLMQRGGSIVLLSSVAASRPGRGHTNYAASKGAVEALTRSVAVELASRNVRVNAVAPGVIMTDMSQEVRDAAGDVILGEISLGRFGDPEEVASAAAFLAGRDASYMTGQVIAVDGGFKL